MKNNLPKIVLISSLLAVAVLSVTSTWSYGYEGQATLLVQNQDPHEEVLDTADEDHNLLYRELEKRILVPKTSHGPLRYGFFSNFLPHLELPTWEADHQEDFLNFLGGDLEPAFGEFTVEILSYVNRLKDTPHADIHLPMWPAHNVVTAGNISAYLFADQENPLEFAQQQGFLAEDLKEGSYLSRSDLVMMLGNLFVQENQNPLESLALSGVLVQEEWSSTSREGFSLLEGVRLVMQLFDRFRVQALELNKQLYENSLVDLPQTGLKLDESTFDLLLMAFANEGQSLVNFVESPDRVKNRMMQWLNGVEGLPLTSDLITEARERYFIGQGKDIPEAYMLPELIELESCTGDLGSLTYMGSLTVTGALGSVISCGPVSVLLPANAYFLNVFSLPLVLMQQLPDGSHLFHTSSDRSYRNSLIVNVTGEARMTIVFQPEDVSRVVGQLGQLVLDDQVTQERSDVTKRFDESGFVSRFLLRGFSGETLFQFFRSEQVSEFPSVLQDPTVERLLEKQVKAGALIVSDELSELEEAYEDPDKMVLYESNGRLHIVSPQILDKTEWSEPLSPGLVQEELDEAELRKDGPSPTGEIDPLNGSSSSPKAGELINPFGKDELQKAYEDPDTMVLYESNGRLHLVSPQIPDKSEWGEPLNPGLLQEELDESELRKDGASPTGEIDPLRESDEVQPLQKAGLSPNQEVDPGETLLEDPAIQEVIGEGIKAGALVLPDEASELEKAFENPDAMILYESNGRLHIVSPEVTENEVQDETQLQKTGSSPTGDIDPLGGSSSVPKAGELIIPDGEDELEKAYENPDAMIFYESNGRIHIVYPQAPQELKKAGPSPTGEVIPELEEEAYDPLKIREDLNQAELERLLDGSQGSAQDIKEALRQDVVQDLVTKFLLEDTANEDPACSTNLTTDGCWEGCMAEALQVCEFCEPPGAVTEGSCRDLSSEERLQACQQRCGDNPKPC